MGRIVVLLIVFALTACDDKLVVNPYLQNPGADHMTVMVETNGESPVLHYRQLGEEVYRSKKMQLVVGSTHVFRGPLKDLTPLTDYEYAIQTEEGV